MENRFNVYDFTTNKSNVMSYNEVMKVYPNSNIGVLNEFAILSIIVYKDGERLAIIQSA